MSLLEQLVSSLPEAVVLDAHTGVFTTAVVAGLEDGALNCGLASTVRAARCSGPVSRAGELRGAPVKEVARFVFSGNGLEASLGMAAINSALPQTRCEEINAEQILAGKAAGKTTAVIGHFPFTERLRGIAGKLLVFELNPRDGLDLPSEKIPELLPEADAVAISAMTLINGTFEGIIKHCRPDAFKLLLGPSAPLSPLVFKHGIDVVSGTRVRDIPLLITHLTQGANFKSLPGKTLVTMKAGK